MSGKAIVFYITFFALLIGTAGCTDPHPMTGRYKGVQENIPGIYSYIELNNDHKGIWETEIDFISFKWEIRDSEIRFHTEAGRVIHGRLIPDGFNIEIPNLGTMVFLRQSP
jgi:hypothetical protein